MMEFLLDVSPGDVAAELTGRDYLSYSAVTTYQTCSIRWFFKYIAGLPEGAVSANLVFGGAIHAGLEAHYQELIQGNPAPPIEYLHQAYRDKFHQCEPDQIRYARGTDRESFDAMALRMLEAFQASDMAAVTGRVVGIEEELRGQVIPGVPQILARIDLLLDGGDGLIIRDFKTARSSWSRAQIDDSAGQLLLYHELVEPMADGRPVRLEFAVITKAKSPTGDAAFCTSRQAEDRTDEVDRAARLAWYP